MPMPGGPARTRAVGPSWTADRNALSASRSSSRPKTPLAVRDMPHSGAFAAPQQSVEDRHDAGGAVDADASTGSDQPGGRRVPTTAGSPYSRATIAAWHIRPPLSETAAASRANTGVQLVEVEGADQDLPILKLAELIRMGDDPRMTLGDPWGRRDAADGRVVQGTSFAKPVSDTLRWSLPTA